MHDIWHCFHNKMKIVSTLQNSGIQGTQNLVKTERSTKMRIRCAAVQCKRIKRTMRQRANGITA
jgi:hypothetical protein